jgi:RNA polymerase sigma factor (sigma-70 family)
MKPAELNHELGTALQAARCGDTAAFAQWVKLTQGMVTALALAITSDPASSEDIAQDTYLEAWRRLPTLPVEAKALAWLREVARNKAIDQLRRRRTEPLVADALDRSGDVVCPSTDPHAALEAQQRIAIALRALQSLSEDAREAILLYYREGERSQRVATLMGVSDAVVRKRLQRARDKLRSEVEQQIKHYALQSAPGVHFGSTLVAALSTVGKPTVAAAGIGTSSALKPWMSTMFGGLWALLASMGLVVAAVLIDTRIHLARARDALQHRRLVRHGIVYAALMGGYMLALRWTSRNHIDGLWVMALALGTTVLIFLLAFWRARILGNRGFSDQVDEV